ncbi:MAG TPA: FUSC family protein [Micromonosporaceae bacterium]|nr:FUSC family protein [Micromonosporaceae bacterium]
MPSTRDHAQRTVDVLSDLGHKSAVRLSDRIDRVRASLILAVQAGIAAGIAWYLAHDVIGHAAPFFAPISAVIVLGVSIGQRLRRAVELVIGVALGIGVGDILIYFIGTGGWQIALVVVLAIITAVFVGGSATLIGQCASSSVLVATLAPPSNGIYYTRFVDALVGGLVGVAVMAILLPVNPLTTVQKAVAPALDLLAAELTGCADALANRDVSRARAALDRMRSSEAELGRFRDALNLAAETASIAPTRWRSRAPLSQYLDSAVHIDRALRNARVLARRTTGVLDDSEPFTDDLPVALRTLADAVRMLHEELAHGTDPRRARQLALAAVGQAAAAYRAGLGFSGDVVVAQVRSIATDLVRATGMDDATSIRMVRRAVGRLAG